MQPPDIVQPQDIVAGKLHNLQVMIPGNCPTKQKENYYDFIEFFQESFFSKNFRVWLPRGCATSGLIYPEIVQPTGIVTLKLHNFRVTIPKNCTTSGYSNLEIGTKKNLFENISAKTKIFWDVDLGPRSNRFMKETRGRKSHATVPLMINHRIMLYRLY